MKELTLDIASMVFMATSRAPTTTWSPKSTTPSPSPPAPAARSSATRCRRSNGGAACAPARCSKTTSTSG
ncbi:P450 heme-thiolate domain protein [Mycobacterium xenopi 3993]|nr:P450 heme-thiolate domain protein [Mycobacterium xenopi 3993]